VEEEFEAFAELNLPGKLHLELQLMARSKAQLCHLLPELPHGGRAQLVVIRRRYPQLDDVFARGGKGQSQTLKCLSRIGFQLYPRTRANHTSQLRAMRNIGTRAIAPTRRQDIASRMQQLCLELFRHLFLLDLRHSWSLQTANKRFFKRITWKSRSPGCVASYAPWWQGRFHGTQALS
jgi:hypothetical protein